MGTKRRGLSRKAKARLSTAVGCTLGAVTMTGPLAGVWLSDWQCKRGLCPHSSHRHRYRP